MVNHWVPSLPAKLAADGLLLVVMFGLGALGSAETSPLGFGLFLSKPTGNCNALLSWPICSTVDRAIPVISWLGSLGLGSSPLRVVTSGPGKAAFAASNWKLSLRVWSGGNGVPMSGKSGRR